MPGWAGSSWYFYRYMDPHNDKEFCSKTAADYWQQVDFYLGGSEHAVGHLLYSRFWNHFLFDLGLAPEREFAKKLVNQGMIQGRSNFVFRARERFFEEYLLIKVLKPFLGRNGADGHRQNRITKKKYKYDFAFPDQRSGDRSDFQQARGQNRAHPKNRAVDGKRLMVLYTEELIDHINEPEVMAEKIRAALRQPGRLYDQ